MAVDTLKPQDLEEQKNKQAAPRHDQFRGLQQSFSQQQSQPKTLPNQAVQGVQKDVANTQNQKNAMVVGQGQQVKQNVDNKNGAFTVGAAPIVSYTAPTQSAANLAGVANRVDTLTGPSTPIATDFNQYGNDVAAAYNADEALRGKALNQLISEQDTQGNAILDFQQQQTQALQGLSDEQNSYLGGLQTTGLTDLGTQNIAEYGSDALNQGLAQDGSNLNKLAMLFNPGYNTERFGGRDSQIYNEEIDGLSGLAKNSLQEQQRSQQGANQSMEQYLQSIKDARTAVDTKQTQSTADINNKTQTAQRELKSKYEEARTATDKGAELQGLRDALLGRVDSASKLRDEKVKTRDKDAAAKEKAFVDKFVKDTKVTGLDKAYKTKIAKSLYKKEQARARNRDITTDGAM